MDNEGRRVGLAITGYKGLRVLEKMALKLREQIDWVVTYGDWAEKIETVGVVYGIPVHKERSKLEEQEADLVFFVGWQYLVDPKDTYVVLHDSLLPFRKGWCPTVNALIEGETFLGVTAFRPTNVMDEGQMLSQYPHAITYPKKIVEAYEELTDGYCAIIESIVAGEITDFDLRDVQRGKKESFSLWRDADDYFIDWTQTREEIQRFVDAVGYPWEGAKTYAPHLLTILEVEPLDWMVMAPKKNAGKVLMLGEQPVIVCGDGAVRITKYEGLPITKLRTRLGCKQ